MTVKNDNGNFYSDSRPVGRNVHVTDEESSNSRAKERRQRNPDGWKMAGARKTFTGGDTVYKAGHKGVRRKEGDGGRITSDKGRHEEGFRDGHRGDRGYREFSEELQKEHQEFFGDFDKFGEDGEAIGEFEDITPVVDVNVFDPDEISVVLGIEGISNNPFYGIALGAHELRKKVVEVVEIAKDVNSSGVLILRKAKMLLEDR